MKIRSLNRPPGIAGLVSCLAATALISFTAHAADKDLKDYRTVKNAVKATIEKQKTSESGQAGFLGIEVSADSRGRLTVTDVEDGSPAAQAGIQPKDVLVSIGSIKPNSARELREWLQNTAPGESVPVVVERKSKKVSVMAKLVPASRPLRLADRRGLLGVQVEAVEAGEGLRVTRVTPDLPAAKAGLKTDDVLLKLNDVPLIGSSALSDLLSTHEAGEKVSVTYRRGDNESHFECALEPDDSPDTSNSTARSMWSKPVYRLGVVCVEFSDVEHNEKIPRHEWEEFCFSTNTYRDKPNATGQKTYGSVNDFYRELSCGQLRVTGKVFDWLKLEKKRADYSQGTASTRTRTLFFNEVLDKLRERDGSDALQDLDGLLFIYAGDRFPTANRGTLFWPHRNTTTYKNKRWPYIICAEGGPRMANISVFCHEFGHILGLPDQYARPENPGSEGLGTWCAMSNQSGNGRPQHFCPWCKERLGWLHPTVINPTIKQKLVLSPVEGTTNECFKVLVRADGSEYLLLENRRKQSFDNSLVADGLLIWRVVGGRLMLEESHGVDGPTGPRVFLGSVPYPSVANNSFTPYTTPSSRSQLGGGLPVYLTNIRKLADGRIAFHIGYEYQ
jgi:M6 family metalloprotease-like protein